MGPDARRMNLARISPREEQRRSGHCLRYSNCDERRRRSGRTRCSRAQQRGPDRTHPWLSAPSGGFRTHSAASSDVPALPPCPGGGCVWVFLRRGYFSRPSQHPRCLPFPPTYRSILVAVLNASGFVNICFLHDSALLPLVWQPTRVLAWRIPWTEEPGGLRYTGSQRVGHD